MIYMLQYIWEKGIYLVFRSDVTPRGGICMNVYDALVALVFALIIVVLILIAIVGIKK